MHPSFSQVISTIFIQIYDHVMAVLSAGANAYWLQDATTERVDTFFALCNVS